MSETLCIMFDENGIAKEYDDTFDITIHCENEEEQNKVLEILDKRWIPVKYRDMTQEEIEQYSEYTDATKMFDCKMPKHQESILVTIEYEYRGEKMRYVDADVCEVDEYGYGLEKHDWEDVVAWMPMVDAYKGGANDE